MVINVSGFGSFVQGLVKRLDPARIDAAANAVANAALEAHKETPFPIKQVREILESLSSPEKQDGNKLIQFAVENPNSHFASVLAQNSNFKPTNEHIQFTVELGSLFASGLAQNSNFTPTNEHIQFAVKNPDSLFASELAQNSNFKPTNEHIQFALNKPNSLFAFELAQNSNFTPTNEHIQFAVENPNSPFASGLAHNSNLNFLDSL